MARLRSAGEVRSRGPAGSEKTGVFVAEGERARFTPVETGIIGGLVFGSLLVGVGTLLARHGVDIADPVKRLAFIKAQTASSKLMSKAIGARELTDIGTHSPAATLAITGKLLDHRAAPLAGETVDFDGAFFQLKGAKCTPLPVQKGGVPIFEPGLQALIQRNRAAGLHHELQIRESRRHGAPHLPFSGPRALRSAP